MGGGILLSDIDSEQIIKIGTMKALKQVSFNQNKFDQRYIPLAA
jgi:hypothetical protein